MRRRTVLLGSMLGGLALGFGCRDATEPELPVPDPPIEPPAQHIAVRRAWLPGERDTLIAQIVRDGSYSAPYAGDFSAFAPLIYSDPDSVTVIVRNPEFAGFDTMPSQQLTLSVQAPLAPQFDTLWNITGLDLLIVDDTQSPPDTSSWVGVFWSNPAEPDWKGFAIAASRTDTVPATYVFTPDFDASFGKTGAGGGEAQLSTGTYWEAQGFQSAPLNTVRIATASYGAPAAVTSGPFTGGTAAAGTMTGRLRTVRMDRLAGTTAPPVVMVDFDFTATAIPSVESVCVFPTPCTGAAALVRSLRAQRMASLAARAGRP